MNLPDDSDLAVIREDLPVMRSSLDDFWGGHAQADTYPLVVPLRIKDGADATQHPRRRLSKEWMLFVRDLNSHEPMDPDGNPDAVNVIFKVEAGWINEAGDPTQQIDPWQIENLPEEEMPKPEFIVSSGTVVRILERTGTGVLLDTFRTTDTPPNATEVNHMTAATRIVHFMAGHRDGYYVNISSGARTGIAQDVYFPLIAPDDAWVPFKDKYCTNRIEFLPSVPRTVTTVERLSVRSFPDVENGSQLDVLDPYKTVTIDKYYPCHTGIWARTVGGWIALQYLPSPGFNIAFYYTDWTLESMPPIRPRHTF